MTASPDPFKPKARRPRGFQDRRGPALIQERAIVAKVLEVYQAWGFEHLDTSAFEYADALGKFLPDQDRPNEGVFAVADDDEQWMALRYDLTAPLARFVAENFDALPKPYRRCAAGPVWRNEKPGPGRFREFWQCDADTVGSASPAADAEMIAMALEAYAALGLGGQVRLKLSTRTLLDGVMDTAGITTTAQRLGVLRAVDKADKFAWEEVEKLLGSGRRDESGDFTKGAQLSAAQIAAVAALLGPERTIANGRAGQLEALGAVAERIGGQAGVAELTAIATALSALGVPETDAVIDVSIVRGLEYYTGAVFEAELLSSNTDEGGKPIRYGSVGGGGRYDDLVSRFKGQPIPATGFSIGVSRLVAALAETTPEVATGPVVVLVMDQAQLADSLQMAQELRRAGIAAEPYLGAAGMKAQLKYADKRASPVAVIQGADERDRGTVTLKDLKLGARMAAEAGTDRDAYAAGRGQVQQEVPRASLVEAVKAMLGGQG